MTPTTQRHCRECGIPFRAYPCGGKSVTSDNGRTNRAGQLFCSAPCRKKFNNRRITRGAELYDIAMAWRFERHRADRLDVRGLLGRVISAYRDADKKLRQGRKSWDLDAAMDRIPLGYSGEGDGR